MALQRLDEGFARWTLKQSNRARRSRARSGYSPQDPQMFATTQTALGFGHFVGGRYRRGFVTSGNRGPP